jgi:hypothetical protein
MTTQITTFIIVYQGDIANDNAICQPIWQLSENPNNNSDGNPDDTRDDKTEWHTPG